MSAQETKDLLQTMRYAHATHAKGALEALCYCYLISQDADGSEYEAIRELITDFCENMDNILGL